MLRRVVIGACLACLTGGGAYAADDQVGDAECTEQLTQAEELLDAKIEANALSEDDAEKANELLDEADALCTEGKTQEATATLEAVTNMVSKPAQ